LDTVNQVPFLDLKAQHHQIYNVIDEKLTDIITHTGFILGKHVDEFEHGFAKIQEAEYCIGQYVYGHGRSRVSVRGGAGVCGLR